MERERLLTELTELRAIALGSIPTAETWHPWRFSDGAPVRLICGARSERDQFAPTRDESRDFVALSHYADLDAMVDLYGHLRAENPDSDVQHRLVTELGADDLRAHLVVLGNLARLQDRDGVLGHVDLPVRQIDPGGAVGGAFELRDRPVPERIPPTFATERPRRPLLEDIGFFYRCASPVDPGLTMTFCSGLFTRGVVGAVRVLLDPRVREQNASWMFDRFGRAHSYGVLMRVPVRGRHVITPNLTDERVVLRTFTDPPA